jgi:hypothetical protein
MKCVCFRISKFIFWISFSWLYSLVTSISSHKMNKHWFLVSHIDSFYILKIVFKNYKIKHNFFFWSVW